jgi:hypothetical protein
MTLEDTVSTSSWGSTAINTINHWTYKTTNGETQAPSGTDKLSMSFQTYGYGLGDASDFNFVCRDNCGLFFPCRPNLRECTISKSRSPRSKLIWMSYKDTKAYGGPNPSLLSYQIHSAIAKTLWMFKQWANYETRSLITPSCLYGNKAFLPKAASIAKDAITYLKQHGSDLLQDNLANEKNLIIACGFLLVSNRSCT